MIKMIIRKIKKLKVFYIYFPLGILSVFAIRIVVLFIQRFFVRINDFFDSFYQKSTVANKNLYIKPSSESIDIEIGKIWSIVVVTWYIQTFSHDWEVYYFLLTPLWFKYMIKSFSWSLSSFSNQWVTVTAEIKDFLWPIPLLKFFSWQIIAYSWKIPRFLSQEQIKILIKNFFSNIPPPFRPIPVNNMSFRSQKWYTIFFPKKVFYEILPIRETFNIPWLLCDNVIFIVWRDKKRHVEENPLYIRDNSRLKIYVCSLQNRYYQLPLEIAGMQYMTTESRTKHFYIHVLHPAWQDFANQIAVRD